MTGGVENRPARSRSRSSAVRLCTAAAATSRCVPRRSAGTSKRRWGSRRRWKAALARFCGRSSARRALHIPLSTRPTTPWPVSSSSRATPAPFVRPPPLSSLHSHPATPLARSTSVPAPLPPASFPRHSSIQLCLRRNHSLWAPANLRLQSSVVRKLVARTSVIKMSSQLKQSLPSSSPRLAPPAWTR